MVQPLRFTIIVLLVPVSFISCNKTDYYWREYTGEIPTDAVIAGRDINKHNVYIGQAYIKNEGLIVAQIKASVQTVHAPIKGVTKTDQHIKILCGSPEKFAWLSTNASRLHLDLLDKQVVIGGHEDGLGSLYIGRINYEGGTQIGKINSFSVGDALFFWADKNEKESHVGSYEVLIYDDKLEIDTRASFIDVV